MPGEHLNASKASHPEQRSPQALGIVFHFGPVILYLLALLIWGITPLSAIGAYAAAAVFVPLTLWLEQVRPCVELPRPALRQIVSGISQVFIKGIALGGFFIAVGWYLLSQISPYRELDTQWSTIFAAVLLTDFGYYLLHRFLSHGTRSNPVKTFYRNAHSRHHKIASLDFLRGNQGSIIDTAFSQFQPCVILISFGLGMSLEATWVAYGIVLLLQTTDHANHTFSIGRLRFLFMDNHAHKLHHCRGGHRVNFGAAFSLFDILFGSYYEDWQLNPSHLHKHDMPLPLWQQTADA